MLAFGMYMDELRYVEYDLGYGQAIEFESIDAGHEVLRVFADPIERKINESGEGGRRFPG